MEKMNALGRAEVPGIVLKYSNYPLKTEVKRPKKN